MKVILILGWIIYSYLWISPTFKKQRLAILEARPNPLGFRGGIFWIAVLASVPMSANLGPGLFSTSNLYIEFTAIAIFGAGLSLAVISKRTLGKFWAPKPTIFRDHKIITSGPYAIVRHPIYLGQFIMAIGSGLISNNALSLLFFAICLFSYNLSRAREEERLLSEYLKDYKPYQLDTPMFFPLRKQ